MVGKLGQCCCKCSPDYGLGETKSGTQNSISPVVSFSTNVRASKIGVTSIDTNLVLSPYGGSLPSLFIQMRFFLDRLGCDIRSDVTGTRYRISVTSGNQNGTVVASGPFATLGTYSIDGVKNGSSWDVTFNSPGIGLFSITIPEIANPNDCLIQSDTLFTGGLRAHWVHSIAVS